MKCLTCNAYREALTEGLAGMIRVNRVAIARSKSGQFPRNVCSVIHQKHQFSWTVRPMTCVSEAGWEKATAAARTAHERQGNGKLYFHTDYVKPRWARYCIGREQPPGDTHIYYSQCFSNSTQLARYKRTNPEIASVDSYTSETEAIR